jgi:threonine/homoserine/homoserine lactone efflux protein
MWLYLLQGIGYGLAAAAQPGPLQTYLISQTLTRGWKRALPMALAPLISDGPMVTICLLVLSQVPTWFERVLYIVGGLFVLYLAHGAYRSWKNFDVDARQAEPPAQQSLLKAALMNIFNPGPYIYWTLVAGPILLAGWRESPLHGLGFLAGFYLMLIGGFAATVMVFGTAAKLGPRINRALLGISVVALLGFGLYQLWLGITT